MVDSHPRLTSKLLSREKLRTFALPNSAVSKKKICVRVTGYIRGFADFVRVLNQESPGLNAVSVFQGVRGNCLNLSKAIPGLVLSLPTFLHWPGVPNQQLSEMTVNTKSNMQMICKSMSILR